MKKIIVSCLLIVVFVSGVFLLTSCVSGDDDIAIKEISATVNKNTVYKTGDAFDTSTITVKALLSDDSESNITNQKVLNFDKSKLKLDADDKFTEAGTFKIEITYLRHKTTLEITVI